MNAQQNGALKFDASLVYPSSEHPPAATSRSPLHSQSRCPSDSARLMPASKPSPTEVAHHSSFGFTHITINYFTPREADAHTTSYHYFVLSNIFPHLSLDIAQKDLLSIFIHLVCAFLRQKYKRTSFLSSNNTLIGKHQSDAAGGECICS